MDEERRNELRRQAAEVEEAYKKVLPQVCKIVFSKKLICKDAQLMYLIRKAVEQGLRLSICLDGGIAIGPGAQSNGPNSIAIGPEVIAEAHQLVIDLDWLIRKVYNDPTSAK